MIRCEHTDRPAAARCVACGKVVCRECSFRHKKKNFCADCAPGKPSGFRSPGFSMFLSLVPGLGQIYAGGFLKGLSFLASAVACVAFHENIPALVPVTLWFLAIWDARMTAQKRNFRITRGRSGSSGAAVADWMLFSGTIGLAALYLGLPVYGGMEMAPWALWSSFLVVLVLSALLGRGGKDAKQS